MAVVARRRAQPLDALELVPRGVAGHALFPVVHDDVLHDVKAGGAQHDGLLRGDAQELAGKLARGGNALKAAVVGAVHALVGKVGAGAQQVQHGTGDVHLLGRGLAARHIELEAARLDLGDLRLEVGQSAGQLGIVHLLIHRLHIGPFPGGENVREPKGCPALRAYRFASNQYTWFFIHVCGGALRPSTLPQQTRHRNATVNGRFLKACVRLMGRIYGPARPFYRHTLAFHEADKDS